MVNDVIGSIPTRIIQIDPKEIKLLDLNARYMRHETFQRMIENVKRDGVLTGVPFGWLLRDDESREPVYASDGTTSYEVLSGNHRVSVAIAAGLPVIDFMVTDVYLSPDRRRAIQLSHNSLVGEDDPEILKTLYLSIEDVGMRVYSGLDDRALIPAVQVEPLSMVNLDFQTIAMFFLPEEVEQAQAALKTAKQISGKAKGNWLLRWAEYDRVMDALEATTSAYGITNVATAMLIVLDLFERHIGDLTEGYLDADGQAIDGKRRVPVASVFGDLTIPAALAAQVKKVIDRGISAGDIAADQRWRILERLTESD